VAGKGKSGMSELAQPSSRSIAVVGMGFLVPGATNPEGLWSLLEKRRTVFREVPEERWNWRTFYSAEGKEPDRLVTGLGSFLEEVEIDWGRLGLYPKQTLVPRMEILGLEAGLRAVRDVQAALPAERTAVVVGNDGWISDQTASRQLALRSFPLMEAVNSALLKNPKQGPLFLQAVRTLHEALNQKEGGLSWRTNGSFLGARLCALFGFRGLNLCVDAAEASFLGALFVAMQGLRADLFDAALCGAVSRGAGPYDFVAWSQARWLGNRAPRPFHSGSGGTLLGEGAVFFVLKRLGDALRANDRIHVLLTGIDLEGCGSTGSFTRPDLRITRRVVKRALEDAGRGPEEVRYAECNGTGIAEHDSVEIEALRLAYADVPRNHPLFVGSIKSNIGHLGACAAAAGLLKMVLAIRHRAYPPLADCDPSGSPLGSDRDGVVEAVRGRVVPMDTGAPRVVAVNALGLGGNHGHLILEGWEPACATRGACPDIRSPDAGERGRPHGARGGPLPKEPIAVVGLGGIYPGAPCIAALVRNIRQGKDAFCEIPPGRWPSKQRSLMKVRTGGFVLEEPAWDPKGIPPYLLQRLDRTHRWVLLSAEEAFRDIGFELGACKGRRTAVLIGDMPAQRHNLADAEMRLAFLEFSGRLGEILQPLGLGPEELEPVFRRFMEEHFSQSGPIDGTALLREKGSMIPALLAKRYQLEGPTLCLEAACSSGFVALFEAIRGLRAGDYDVAVLGSSWSSMTPENFFAMQFLGLLTQDRIRPFDLRADGYLMGEGAGVFLLKRVSDARKDGDRIYALIRGVGGSAEGSTKVAFVPNWRGQALAIERAQADAEVDPDSIRYIECTGSALPIGDNSELKALGEQYRCARGPVSIGSVKSMVGNLHGAANGAALTQAVLALFHKTLPPTLGHETPSKALRESPFHVQVRSEPWPAPSGGEPRRAAVNVYAMSGTSLHVILEEAAHGES